MKKRILVIDDDADITQVIKIALELRGPYVVYEENNSRKAINAARSCDPDLIILDMMMPGRSGTEVAADLREEPRLADVPILFLTALLSEEETHDPKFGLANRHCMAKPVDFGELASRIEKICSKRTGPPPA